MIIKIESDGYVRLDDDYEVEEKPVETGNGGDKK